MKKNKFENEFLLLAINVCKFQLKLYNNTIDILVKVSDYEDIRMTFKEILKSTWPVISLAQIKMVSLKENLKKIE